MAHGGRCDAHGLHMCEMCHGGKMMEDGGEVETEHYPTYDREKGKELSDSFKKFAEGGYIHEEEASGYEDMPEEHEDKMYSHPLENQDDHEDMVGHIMKQRAKHFSKGGKVANDTPIKADFEENDFDVLPKEDDLEEHYTGKNSGDEIGDEAEDEDRRDMVSQIMKSRAKKGRMPRPA